MDDCDWAFRSARAIPGDMSLPRQGASAARRDDAQEEPSAARSGRFRVRIDKLGRIVPEVQPVATEDEDNTEPR